MTEHEDRRDAGEPDPEALTAEPTASEALLSPRTTDPKPELPVVVLRDMVIYPGVTVPMSVGRADTLSAIQAAAESPDRRFFALLQREKSDETDPLGLHTIGVMARVVQLQQGLGGTQALVLGLHRGIALRIDSMEQHLVATVSPAEELMPVDPEDLAFIALDEELRNRAAELGERAGIPSDVLTKTLRGVTDPGRLADLVAGHLELPAGDHQSLLETLAVEERMRRVLMLVQRRIKVLNAQQDINTQVEEEIGDRQREMYLREQLKAIRKELGDDDGADDLEELKERVAGLELPPAARKEVERELKRLERMGRESMESQVIRTYIDTVCELPWSELSEERLDLADAARILDKDHYGLEDTKDRILEFLAVRVMHDRQTRRPEHDAETADEEAAASPEDAGSGQTDEEAQTDQEAERSPILLFVGPPGVGKTSIAKSIARAMGREYVRVSLGGARDEADIRGHRRTYVGAMPGRILHGMKQAGVKNPVFLLDEVDKLGASLQGDPSAALLEVLDPAQNGAFIDHYLGVPYDLSQVLFIATANFIQNIPAPLRDRMETVEFSGYTEHEKENIARQFLLPRAVRSGGLLPKQIEVGDDALREVISHYTHEAGVRQLERELGRMVRKVARRLASTPEDAEPRDADATTQVGASEVREFLGRPRVRPERALERDAVGVATGMYYTPMGGDIMFVEVETTKGKGRLELTGQLGDVMKESASAAWTYAKSRAEALQIPAAAFETDVHIHVPAGAIPKDGPSAGVTMAAALVSALSGRPAKAGLAMTGEITLSGRVLPIGGVKEKVLGAVRAGIREIVLPKQNEADLEDLPDDVRESLSVYAVEELGEVLAVALPDARFVDGRLLFEGDDPEQVRRLSYN
ncbi:MAG: endopeptidase La [Acidobacteria bacterium]|nr:endopeptidase La [Acidobacteriota bacterium]